MVQAKEIFKGFCRHYNSLNILYDESISTHTGRLLSYFDTLGRMLGYRIYTEYSMKKLGIPCSKDLENRKLDMIWWYFDEKGEQQYELAVESQQTFDLSLIEKDVKKLVAFPSNSKVLYCAARNHLKISQMILDELKHSQKAHEDKFLAIIDPWVNSTTFGKGSMRGILFNSNGKLFGEGTAEIGELRDGVHLMRVLLQVEWKE